MKTFKDLREAWKKYPGAETDSELGPHQGHELDLLLSGKKPVALISNDRMHKFEPHVKSGKLIKKPVALGGYDKPDKPSHHVVAPPHEEKRMHMVAKEFEKKGRDHARIGIGLGYSKKDIRAFIKHVGERKSGR